MQYYDYYRIYQNIIAMYIETTKQRIVRYLNYKDIKLSQFYKDTGLKRGLLDSDKLHQGISDKYIYSIINKYKDLSVEWLLTGKGSMLKSIDITESQQAKPTEATYSFEAEYYKKQLAEKEDEIAALNQEIGRLKAIIENSKSNT